MIQVGPLHVMPAQAGIHDLIRGTMHRDAGKAWMPAYAGKTWGGDKTWGGIAAWDLLPAGTLP